MIVPNPNSETGLALAERLGLTLHRRAGHDLAGPCVACSSSDAFRLHVQTGVAHCFSCNGKWSPFQLSEFMLKDRSVAKGLMVELGLFEPSHNGNGQSPKLDPIFYIAKQKGITSESLRAFGATIRTPTTITLPAYGPDGQACTGFTMSIDGGKGKFAKGKRAGLFFPHVDGTVRLPQPAEIWHVVEGPKDAAALHGLDLRACGLNTCRLAPKFARLFMGVDIVLVPDRDRAGIDGGEHSARALFHIANSVRIAVLPAEVKDSKGEDVRDVIRRDGGREAVLQAIGDAQPWEPPPDADPAADTRLEIEVTPDEHKMNDDVVKSLANDDAIFQRGATLVQILRDHGAKTLTGISRPPNTPRIATIKEATLRERLTAVARFVKRNESEEGVEIVHVHPPNYCVAAVASRGHWPKVRHLEGIIGSPIIRSDGTILQKPGYDDATGLVYEPDGNPIELPDDLTLEDARAACQQLLEVVVDFPFATDAHQASWVAYVLTPLARYAFKGPSPLFLLDANVRASGKSLLSDAASLIVTGRPMPRMSCPEDDDESRKRITAVALGGDQMVLIDNIDGELGSASLDAALTGTVWKDRILGRSEMVEMPLITTWSATGNNVVLRADTSRRVCHIRLESKWENPEARHDFKQPELLAWVAVERPRLLAAALTILAAYCRAGRIEQGLKPWGSFEGWSRLVRQAVVWVGLPDPGETREELARSSDREASALRSLIQGWHEIDPDGMGLTVSKLLSCLDKAPDGYELVRNAILELCPAPAGKLPGTRSVGNKLSHLQDRVVGGRAISKRDQHGTAVWFVANVAQSDPRLRTTHGGSGGSGCSSPAGGQNATDQLGPTSDAYAEPENHIANDQPDQLAPPHANDESENSSNGGTWDEGYL
jgi:hypothetical protein